ncbi:MAG TPA: T9SS type A sorting domain-containing protein [Bacteroidia bacterium]|nr:T9SS type A sorting domain-containing protein [Bacteroidia bacterium]
MKKFFLGLLIISLGAFSVNSQAPSIQWSRCYGGSGDDGAYSVCRAPGGGYYIAGFTTSHDGDVSIHSGNYEHFWLIRIDEFGTILWEKTYGGTWGIEIAKNIQLTSDGGTIMIGEANSNDGDVVGIHGGGVLTGTTDVWVVKTDSSGNLLWQKCLGGNNLDYGYEIHPTLDGGYILCAETDSWDGDITNYLGGAYDAWVVKLDSIGNLEWQKTFGGTDLDFAKSVVETDTNTFWCLMTTSSTDHDVLSNHGESDIWLVKIDPAQNILQQSSFGGSLVDGAIRILKKDNGSFLISGVVESNNGNVYGNHGLADYWLFQTNGTNLINRHTFGGSDWDYSNSASITSDGGVLLSGMSYSSDSMPFCNTSSLYNNVWVVKTDSLLNYQWSKCMGGNLEDEAFDGIETPDGGYLVVGYTKSFNGDVHGMHPPSGTQDAWVVKLAPSGVGVPELSPGINEFTACPNAHGEILLQYNTETSASLHLSLFDLTGRNLFQESVSSIAGKNSYLIPSLALPTGMYVLSISDGINAVQKKIFVGGNYNSPGE